MTLKTMSDGHQQTQDEADRDFLTAVRILAQDAERICNWHAGCDQLGDPDTDDLCPFHFDACERTEHADAQAAHEARQRSAAFCQADGDL